MPADADAIGRGDTGVPAGHGDGFDAAARAGATAVVQPGGSKNDPDVIAAADEQDVAMVFTGRRHFRH